METDYFVSNFYYDNEMIVNSMDNDENYKNCVNLGKAASFTDVLNFQQQDTNIFKTIQKRCEKVYPPVSYSKPDKSIDIKKFCKNIAQDNDYEYVTCLKQNGIKHRIKQNKKISVPVKEYLNEPNDDYIVKDKIFPPNLTTFSCRDTIDGFCRENLTLNECINLCDKNQDCSYGYYIQKGKNSFCLPLMENMYNLNEKNCLNFLSYDASEFGFPIKGNIFYKKSLQLSDDPNPRIGMYYLRYKDNYLQGDCSFGSIDTAILLNFFNIDQENYLPLNKQNYLIVDSENLTVLVYHLAEKNFSFEPGLLAKDNTFVGLKRRDIISFFTCSVQNDVIQIFYIASNDLVYHFSVVDDQLTMDNKTATDFRLENKKDITFSRIPVSSFKTYYQRLIHPTQKKSIFILVSICILATVLLLLYIFL